MMGWLCSQSCTRGQLGSVEDWLLVHAFVGGMDLNLAGLMWDLLPASHLVS